MTFSMEYNDIDNCFGVGMSKESIRLSAHFWHFFRLSCGGRYGNWVVFRASNGLPPSSLRSETPEKNHGGVRGGLYGGSLLADFGPNRGCFEVVSDLSCDVSKVFQGSHGPLLEPIELPKLLDTPLNHSVIDFLDVKMGSQPAEGYFYF